MDQNLQGKTEITQQRRRGILPRSPLVPKLNLGTHLPAKLYFAVRRHGRSVLHVALLTLLFPGSVRIALAEEPNTLTPAEKNNGWQLLFDGQTTKGWRGYKSTTMPASWKAENGSLLSRHEQGDTTGDIITVDEYGDFELTLEWKMTKGGNVAGGLGLDKEFFESIMVPQVMLHGFLGFHPTADGFTLNPRLPKDWPEFTITRIHLQGAVLDITVRDKTVTVTGTGKADESLVAELPTGWQLTSTPANLVATK